MCHHSECGCGEYARPTPGPVWHKQGGSCCGSGHAPRRFRTGEETVEQLEEHLKELRAEANGVEERIAELKREG